MLKQIHLSANTTFLKIVPVNPTIVKGLRKHNPIHFCVSFLFAEACYAVSLLCVPMAFFVGYLRGFRWQTQIKGFEEFPRIWTCLNRDGRVPSFKQGRMMTQILVHKLNIILIWSNDHDDVKMFSAKSLDKYTAAIVTLHHNLLLIFHLIHEGWRLHIRCYIMRAKNLMGLFYIGPCTGILNRPSLESSSDTFSLDLIG